MIEEFNDKTHESFGMVQFNRISCGGYPTLFGSETNTNQYIQLVISQNAHVADTKGGRRFYPSSKMKDRVVEVNMSYAQFATLITNLNCGVGTPCTIKSLGGVNIPDAPEDELPENLIDVASDIVRKEMASTASEVKALRQEIEALFGSGKALKAADKAMIRSKLAKVEQNLTQNIPFFVRQAGEQIESIQERAKVEIASIITNNLISAGVKSLGVDTTSGDIKAISETSTIDLDND